MSLKFNLLGSSITICRSHISYFVSDWLTGRVYMVDFDNLSSLEALSIRGVQWCWDAICIILQQARDVKHLFMKVEFTGNESLQPFPEIDFVEFFNNHPKLQTFDIHGAMFAALCQKNSLKKVNIISLFHQKPSHEFKVLPIM